MIHNRMRPHLVFFMLAWLLSWACASVAQPANPTLVLNFENSLVGAQGESPTQATGITYEAGMTGQGAYFPPGNQVRYNAAANIDARNGSLEFWIKPRWSGGDGLTHTILVWGSGGGMLFAKDGANNLRCIFNRFAPGGQPERGVAINISAWAANQWHHVAYTWNNSALTLRLYVDGSQVASSVFSGTLPLIADATFQLGGEGTGSSLNAVLDSLRISDGERTAAEIAQSYLSGLTINSLSIQPQTLQMYVTWQRTPTLSAATNLGTISVPPAAAQWSTTNPAVATVNAAGRVTAVGAGPSTITASLGGQQAPLLLTVIAPARPLEFAAIDPFLATPSGNYLYEVPVVSIRYIPTADGVSVDPGPSGHFGTVAELLDRINHLDIQTKFMLEEGSRFRGYRTPSAKPSLGYRVVKIINVYEELPPDVYPGHAAGAGVYFPDYNQILTRLGADQWVNSLGVKEVWLWGYHYGAIVPVESNMSSPTTGDISNSYRFNDDLPIYSHTYTLYNYNFDRSSNESVHNHGHQLESILGYVCQRQDGNSNLFWRQFVGQNASGQPITGRCGNTHMPPNTTVDYDYYNMTLASSDIEHWTPAGTGPFTSVNAATWGGLTYAWPYGHIPEDLTQHQWYVYWMQNMPGQGNGIPYGASSMTNWWWYTGDWDIAISATGPQRGLYAPGTTVIITQQPASQSVPAGQSLAFSAAATGTGPLNYRWRRNGVPLSDGGPLSGTATPVLSIAPASAADTGAYTVVVSNATGSVVSDPATLNVVCYANCDASPVAPVLNANDFQCFLNNFAAGSSYANCDGSVVAPVLNANDFQCYLNRFAVGCT